MGTAEGANLGVRKFVGVLLRRKSAILGSFLIVFLLAVAWTFLTPRKFLSQAKLFIRLGRENATLDPTSTVGQGPAIAVPNSREEDINSIIEVIQSRQLLEQVVDKLGPDVVLGGTKRADRKAAVRELSSNLSVYAVKRSTVINIDYQAPSVELADSVLSTLIEAFLEEHGKLNRTPGGYAFLEEQAHRVEKTLHEKEEDFRRLKEKTGLYSVKEQRENLVKQIGALEQELLDAESALAAAQVEASHLKKKLGGMPLTQISARTKGGPSIDNVRAQLHALQLKETELRARYGENHRELKQVIEQKEEALRLLSDEERFVEQTVTSPHKAADEAELELLRQEAAVAALEAKVPVLRSQLKNQTDRLKTFDEDSVAVNSLQRDVELNESLYRKYSENVEQGLIDNRLNAERISNVAIAQGATSDGTSVRPRWSFNLAVGLLIALGFSLGLGIILDRADPLKGTPALPTWLDRLI
jgi:uncharacterized protein involved in exopolysaccharide biosynthesis